MSMKVTKVDGSVDENNGLKYTVGDKSQGLLSRTIDKALGGMQESSEDAAQNNHPVNSVQNSSTEASNDTHEDPTHSPPEVGSTWPLQTASAESRANDEKAISDKTITEKAVVAEDRRGEGDYREVYCCKCYSRGGRCEDELRIRTRRRCSRMYQGR